MSYINSLFIKITGVTVILLKISKVLTVYTDNILSGEQMNKLSNLSDSEKEQIKTQLKNISTKKPDTEPSLSFEEKEAIKQKLKNLPLKFTIHI